MTMGLTPKQSELLGYLIKYSARHNVMPTVSEMANGVCLRSKSGILRLLDGLESRGTIRRIPNKARAVEIVQRDIHPTTDLALRLFCERTGMERAAVIEAALFDYFNAEA